MKKALQATHQEFESSSSRTPEYLAWHRLFKREFTKFLTGKGATLIQIGKPNHFDMSGFFTLGTLIWYFSVSDIRWSKDSMLIRIAKHYKDYTGGMNQYTPLSTEEAFTKFFDEIVLPNPDGELQPINQSTGNLVNDINAAQYRAMAAENA